MINSYSTSDYYEDLTIPSEIKGIPVTAIKDKAFANVTLKSINLPDTIKYIGKEAFRESTIESINLPTDLEVIEDKAFQFSELKGELVFPDNLRYIGASAFEINSLESVVFNANLEVIETNAFLYCNLTNVVFKGNANKLEKIGVGAFLSTEVENKIPIENFKKLKIYDTDNPIFELPEGEIYSNNLGVYKGFDFELANKYNNLDNFRTLYNTDK
ncbi:leucine-rich repeat domain-containing protein (plasmid) [Enterococcus faecium]|uniref:Leucine-rich repeat domain-containing protein n=2 Tax=Enterococcus gallinarum TaxID=1353 RepID=A0AAE7MTD5_ENTGA|nr:leucine-rich repeat domain-containing protein [Enterococcus faecium]QOG29295.1 leucine-rich repeat domain-containing protein [Enterococcus gallinarum]MBK0860908.1 leucine-rich repeat domain-containing protein [Enterococcus faecium]QMX56575.1 leucine-rich repeat domain-containing protein [Enterococcus faecium]QOJ75731.1 leucine-rich repeat domain-containing protein [Enterococcus faecium]